MNQQITKAQMLLLFGCSIEQLNDQFAANAQGLDAMRIKAKQTGKKVNGYTEQELTGYTKKYINLSKSTL